MRRRRALAALLVVVLAGCAGAPSALDPHSSQARHISGIWWLMFWMAAAVYVIVAGLVLFAFARRRRKPHSERFAHRFIVYGGVVVPVAILGVVAVFTIQTTNDLVPQKPAVRVTVTGELWWWRVAYPDLGVTTANEIHVPVGQTVEITLVSDNIIHSFWVPQLAGKTDLIPGQTNHLSFAADRPGVYRGQCAEFCGLEHALMAFQVVADAPDAFAQWTRAQRATPAPPSDPTAVRGRTLFVNGPCAGCHTVAGTSATGTLGPDLTHVGSRMTLAAATLPNTPANMHRWLAETQSVKRGALMPELDLSPDEVDALVAYLEGLR